MHDGKPIIAESLQKYFTISHLCILNGLINRPRFFNENVFRVFTMAVLPTLNLMTNLHGLLAINNRERVGDDYNERTRK